MIGNDLFFKIQQKEVSWHFTLKRIEKMMHNRTLNILK